MIEVMCALSQEMCVTNQEYFCLGDDLVVSALGIDPAVAIARREPIIRIMIENAGHPATEFPCA